MVDEKKNQEKNNRKYRLLKLINKIMLGLGVLFLLYVACMYVLFFLHTHAMGK